MKINQVLLCTCGLAVCGIAAFWFETRPAPTPPPPSEPSFAPARAPSPRIESEPPFVAAATPSSVPPETAADASAPVAAIEPAPVAPIEPAKTAEDLAAEETVALLISPEASFVQKQAAWAGLRNNPGQTDRTIALLEQRAQENPQDAEIPAQLGLAYLMKISTSQDVREQGMGGMKADLSFDAALKLDPTNWSANFLKAQALMHWPDSMNMGPQVVQRFTALIEQQESQPSRPEFAMTYQMLGEQYQKSGKTEEARQVWTRGLSYFPNSRALAQKLNPAP
jgi:hypothetical protein